MKKILIFIILLFNTTFGQIIELPSGISLSNQLEFSYDKELQRQTFENWFNLNYSYGNFKTGLRYEVFQPNDINPAVNRGKVNYSDISFKYLEYEIGEKKSKINTIIGNYYTTFGRGLLLKIYEDRNVRVDNNLQGIKFEANFNNFRLKAVSGMAENSKAERKDVLRGFDAEFRGIDKLNLGFSVVSNQPYFEEFKPTTLFSGRFAYKFDFFDIYTEYGIKKNSQLEDNLNQNYVGKAIYSNLNFYIKDFSISTEFKYYDNFKLTSYDGTIIYNTPPSLTFDYSYILLNRHPFSLNHNNEVGFHISADYLVNDENKLTVNYGRTYSLEKDSFFKKISNSTTESELLLEDIFAKFENTSNYFGLTFGFGYKMEAITNTKSLTPVCEFKYFIDEVNTIKAVVEHQQNNVLPTDEKYFDDVITLEWMNSPDFSLSFVGEMETREPEIDKIERNFWGFIRFGYNLFDNSEITLLAGTRQAGNICIGGVCRYEPEFSGIELKYNLRIF
jgi:hypothetical protein